MGSEVCWVWMEGSPWLASLANGVMTARDSARGRDSRPRAASRRQGPSYGFRLRMRFLSEGFGEGASEDMETNLISDDFFGSLLLPICPKK